MLDVNIEGNPIYPDIEGHMCFKYSHSNVDGNTQLPYTINAATKVGVIKRQLSSYVVVCHQYDQGGSPVSSFKRKFINLVVLSQTGPLSITC